MAQNCVPVHAQTPIHLTLTPSPSHFLVLTLARFNLHNSMCTYWKMLSGIESFWHMHAHYIFRPKQPRSTSTQIVYTFWDSDQIHSLQIHTHTHRSTMAPAEWKRKRKKRRSEHYEPSISILWQPIHHSTFHVYDVDASVFRYFLSHSSSISCFRCISVENILWNIFSVAFRHVCHFAQNKTKPKAINYISDAGGIYHDIILFFSFAKKNNIRHERTREKKIWV